MTSALLLPLARADNERRFGGKATGLNWLVAQGCMIPEGVVLPVAVFEAHTELWGLTEAIEALYSNLSPHDDEQLQTDCHNLQQAILNATLSDDLFNALQHFWQEHQKDTPKTPLAVRSSAPGEDGQNASFAGQFDSVLNISNFDSLQQAIRQVWASTFNPHALLYGQHQQQTLSTMAVIIQQQVGAEISGVLFTQNPAGNGEREMLLEYCEGLADRLVSGEITPVSLVIERELAEVAAETSPSLPHQRNARKGKDKPLPNPPLIKGGSLISFHTDTSDKRLKREQKTQLLEHLIPTLQKLSQQALALEQAASKPLDIEWCIDLQQQAYFVQCRPMTRVQQKAKTPQPEPTELWSNANMAENFPEPVVPLLASFVPRGYAGYFRGLGRAFGINQKHMDKAKDAFDGLVGLQAGRLYYNLSQIFTVIHLVPGGAWLAQSFNLFTGAEGSPAPQQFHRPWYQQLWQGVKIAYHVPRQFLRVEKRVATFERMIDDYAAKTHPDALPQQSPVELANHLRVFLDIRLKRWSNAALADTAAMVCYAALQALIKRWLPNADAQLHNDLLQGLPGLASARPVEELWQLSTRIQRDSVAQALFYKHAAAELIHILPEQVPHTWQDIQEYLEHWGFRYSGELMLTQETPAENPEAVLMMLQSYLDDIGYGPRYLSHLRAMQREKNTEQIAAKLTASPLLRRLPLPTRAAIFRRLISATHGAIRLRERARMKQALLYTRLRHVCLKLGDELVQREWLNERDDVFYLEIDEAIALAEKAATQSDSNTFPDEMSKVRETIAQRRADMAHFLTLDPPEQMTLSPGEVWHPGMVPSSETDSGVTSGNSNNDDVLTGMSACGGQASGTAAVLTDVTQINSLTPGSILVTRQTDPGWAPVFFLVKGLVIERGGMLSHGAIIAREYGIPAVVGVAQATQLIEDGDTLTVDGTLGRVYQQKPPEKVGG